MPEGPEVAMTAHYLNKITKDKPIKKVKLVSGKYKREGIQNIDLLNKHEHKVMGVGSKGKLLFFFLYNNIKNEVNAMTVAAKYPIEGSKKIIQNGQTIESLLKKVIENVKK